MNVGEIYEILKQQNEQVLVIDGHQPGVTVWMDGPFIMPQNSNGAFRSSRARKDDETIHRTCRYR